MKTVHTQMRHLRERGQALTETALIMVVLIFMLSMVIDAGRAFFTALALQNAAGEGAYYGSAFPLWKTSAQNPDPDNIVYRTQHEIPVGNQLVTWEDATVAVTYIQERIGAPQPGDYVVVTITYPFQMIGPMPGLLGWNGEIPIRVRASQIILTTRLPQTQP